MSKIFYDHIVMSDELHIDIEHLEISLEEKSSLKKIFDSIFHNRLLTHILNILPKEHHEDFLTRFYDKPHDIAHVRYLSEKTQLDMMSELHQVAKKTKTELKSELKKHKKK